MNLTTEPDFVNWPATHYIFIEKAGPFQEAAPQAWGAFHALVPKIEEQCKITGYFSLYKMGPSIYRAGVSVEQPPVDLPDGLSYEVFAGGAYGKFVLTGPYAQLGPASGRVWQIVAEKGLQLRDDFAIEHYVTDPRVTPPDQLITAIMVPLAG